MLFIMVGCFVILLDNPILQKKMMKNKRAGVHPLTTTGKFTEFHYLFTDLRKFPSYYLCYKIVGSEIIICFPLKY